MLKNYKKRTAHVCVHTLEMEMPQSLLRTSFQFRKFSPASNRSFFSLFFFEAHCLCCRVKIKEIPFYSPCTSFSMFLFSSLAQLATTKWTQYLPVERDWDGPSCCSLLLLGRSQLGEVRVLGHLGLAGQVTLLHNPPE